MVSGFIDFAVSMYLPASNNFFFAGGAKALRILGLGGGVAFFVPRDSLITTSWYPAFIIFSCALVDRAAFFLIRKCTREATWKAVISPSALGAFRFRSLHESGLQLGGIQCQSRKPFQEAASRLENSHESARPRPDPCSGKRPRNSYHRRKPLRIRQDWAFV